MQLSDFGPTTFMTSRQLDFLSEAELIAQTGHDPSEWLQVTLKEAIDNGIDACEDASIVPEITITVDENGVLISDNGPGLPKATIDGVLDFTVRASSRNAYTSITRGGQGNALKTFVGMSYVLGGALVVESCGEFREVQVTADPISQQPVISVNTEPSTSKLSTDSETQESYKFGTTVGLRWPNWPAKFLGSLPSMSEITSTWLIKQQCFALIRCFVLLNPHCSFCINWFGKVERFPRTNPAFKKWTASQPSSSHWYDEDRLCRLIGAHVSRDQRLGIGQTVADFMTSFDGLKGTRKRSVVLEETGLSRAKLCSLVTKDGFDLPRIRKLLSAMQDHTKAVKPARLGVVGREHLEACLTAWGCLDKSIRYKKIADYGEDGLPVVLEVSFGVITKSLSDPNWEGRRQMFAGINFSACIKNPFRTFAESNEGLEQLLTDLRVSGSQPVIFAIHLTRPAIQYTDRGKSAIAL